MTTFLCTHCRVAMCNDCRQIADEYQELLEARTRALGAAEYELRKTKQELESTKLRANLFEQISKAGLPAIITAWMEQDIKTLLEPLTGLEAHSSDGAGVEHLRKVAQALVDYRKRAGPLGFQLEKADVFLRELELTLAGEVSEPPIFGN